MKALVVKLKRKDCPGLVPGLSKTLMLLLCFFSLLNAGCKKDIEEPKHKNKGKNVIYLKIDEQEFLIKEGFSLNKNVIRADIGGVSSRTEPTYNEGEYFGRKTGSLAFNFAALKSHEFINTGSWYLGFYNSENSVEGLYNSINLEFKSTKHGRNILIWNRGYGWQGEYAPKINIIKHDSNGHTISGTLTTRYYDFKDSTLMGDFYMYFDLEY